MYGNAVDSYMLIVYPGTLLNLLISSKSFLGRFLGIFYTDNGSCHLQIETDLFLPF